MVQISRCGNDARILQKEACFDWRPLGYMNYRPGMHRCNMSYVSGLTQLLDLLDLFLQQYWKRCRVSVGSRGYSAVLCISVRRIEAAPHLLALRASFLARSFICITALVKSTTSVDPSLKVSLRWARLSEVSKG